ncbi:MAG TPA: hypothetical protein VJ725_13395 [Thermoanaerobaculia bacterium]|nr:hypothetical protein [Thermoanaerobaculia bacterium]
MTVLSTGCKESPRFVKEGALFALPEKASPGKALVYVYWPREEQGQRDRLWVGPCEGLIEEILPGGYITLAVEPGPSCFNVEAYSELLETGDGLTSATMIQHLGSVELKTKPDRTSFIRLEQRRFPLISRINPRPVEPAVAGPEIRKCRRMVPLTPEELEQQFLQEMESRGQDS